MAERAELLGGRLAVSFRPGVGTMVTAIVLLARTVDTSIY
jgi:signal transduction histidine kinase